MESELINSYLYSSEGPFVLNRHEIEKGDFFTMDEIKGMIKCGEITANLAYELNMLNFFQA